MIDWVGDKLGGDKLYMIERLDLYTEEATRPKNHTLGTGQQKQLRPWPDSLQQSFGDGGSTAGPCSTSKVGGDGSESPS